jgi:hypothetical protein
MKGTAYLKKISIQTYLRERIKSAMIITLIAHKDVSKHTMAPKRITRL